jgi:hypothetical protein
LKFAVPQDIRNPTGRLHSVRERANSDERVGDEGLEGVSAGSSKTKAAEGQAQIQIELLGLTWRLG